MRNVKITLCFHSKVPDDATTINKLLARGIQWITRSKYFHVEFIYNDIWYSMEQAGSVKRRLTSLSNKYTYIDISRDLTEEQYKIFLKFINIDYEYDYTGILLSQILGLGLDNKDKWFCSEFCTQALKILVVEEVIFLQPAKISPKDLYVLFKKDKYEVL